MKMHEVVTTLLACNAFSTKSFTYPIMEKTQSNILLSSVTSRIHITDSMALEWHISLAVYSIHIVTTSLHYLSAPRQDQQLDEDRLVTSDKLRCLDYLGLSYISTHVYNWSTILANDCCVPRHRPVPWPPSWEMNTDSNQHPPSYRTEKTLNCHELSIIGLRFSVFLEIRW